VTELDQIYDCDANVPLLPPTVVSADTKPSIISNITAALDADSLTPLPRSSLIAIGIRKLPHPEY